MFFEKNHIDSNKWEKNEIKKLSLTEKKNHVKHFTKKTSATLLAIMLVASNTSAKNIFSKIWHKIKKHTHITYSNTDWNDHYNTDYYEKYNTTVKHIENTNLSGIDNLNVRWWILYTDWQKLSLVSAQNVVENDKFLKENDLDEVVIRINWTPFKAKPKFLRLSFQASGRKWVIGYEVWKTITLVYVSYLNKIKVLWTIDKYAWYIDENNPKEYEVLSSVENKKILYNKISNLLWCRNCRYKKDNFWNIYFYSNWVNVGTLNDLWNEKILTKWNKVIAKIIKHWNNILMTDAFWNIFYKSNGQKILDIKLPTAWERIVLGVQN